MNNIFPLRFFNPSEEIRVTRNGLPHWQQPGATYSLTFRMADAIPIHLRRQLEEDRETWLKFHPHPWDERTEAEYHKRFSAVVEGWSDAGHGSCLLREPRASELVGQALMHFDRDRHLHHNWTVMPNHVHVVTTLHADRLLEDVLHSWKGYTSHRLVKMFPDAPNPFWQCGYFDRMIRNEEHFGRCVRYVQRNPIKAQLGRGDYRQYASEFAKRYLR